MTTVTQYLNDVHNLIHTDDKVMAAARQRRDRTLARAAEFGGVRYTYRSGSVAMGVVINPVLDADGGIVLDRRVYPTLGPDGGGELPADIVGALHDFLGPNIREEWPKATVHTMRRGLTVRFHDPILEQDPYVDVVVAMERSGESGLWIPNIKAGRWDAANPQAHAEMMNTGEQGVMTTRARVVRIAKAWNKQYSEPAFCSFNMVALALESNTVQESLADGFYRFLDDGVRSLQAGCTADPAGVSGAIRLPLGKDIAIQRMTAARDNLAEAMAANDDNGRLAAMHNVFWNYLPAPDVVASKDALAAALSVGSPRVSTVGALSLAGATKRTQAYGGNRG